MMPRHTARSSDYLQPRTILENLSWCPGGVATYVALHMDSIGKILNHLLIMAFLLDCMLFVTSWSVSFLPGSLSFNTTFIAFLLAIQSVVVWLVLNHHRISIAACLAPTEFKVGMAFGLCIGAAILSFFVTHAFARPDTICAALNASNASSGNSHLRILSETVEAATNETETNNDDDTTTNDNSQQQYSTLVDPTNVYLICSTHKGSMVAVWFWAGLSFWCNFVSCLLLWVGQGELANATPYENLSMEDYEDHFRRQQVAGTVVGNGGSAFVGDYATVPEIRPDATTTGGGSSANPIATTGGYGPSSNTGYSDTPALASV